MFYLFVFVLSVRAGLNNGAFEDCSSLTSITIPFVGNGSDEAHFGSIFGANQWYSDNSQNVPSSLKTVIITGGTSIGDDAFNGCSSLTSIVIPDGVTSIGSSAFSGCINLTDIQFKGTVEEWQTITKSGGWDHVTGEYTVTCTDGTVKKDGTVTKN